MTIRQIEPSDKPLVRTFYVDVPAEGLCGP